MIEVGVLTMHRVLNYGSALQAYATQCVIERMGYNCEIIDYKYPNKFQFERGEPYSPLSLKSRIAKAFWLNKRWRKFNRFELFYKRYLHLSHFYEDQNSIRENPPAYDIYLTGSDQVWNPRFTKGDTIFLLDFVKGKKKISYASSFACNELEKPYSDKFKSMLQEYSYISVREDGGRKLIKDLLNIDVPVVLDPTLLLSADDWSRLLGQEHSHKYKNRKYILVYMLDYAFDPTSIIYNVIQKLQDDTSYKIVSIGNLDKKLANCKIIEEASPIEFIRLFKNAECVVTSSFHGTAFAVNFGKPLFSIANIDTNKDDRQASLLELLELSNCIVTQDTDINNIKLENNKTIKAEQKLESQRKKSLAYLKNALQQYE